VPIRAARQLLTRVGASRAGQVMGLAALALLLAGQNLRSAVAEGDTRTISFHHIHTGEDLTITYMRNGRYDPDALKQINHELRDWRRNEEIQIDPRLIDAVWQAYHDAGAQGPIHVVCGYRSPATNAMLRRRSRGVAQFSQHMLGRAMDFFIPGVPLEKLREAGLRLQRGGVGFYPTSGSPFVHMDVGNVRHWPRMTREQLVRVFPDGRTVHIPSDGHPLAGYALALADIQKRKSSAPSEMSLEAARTAGVDVPAQPQQKNLFAGLFSSKDEDEDNDTAAQAPQPVSPPPAPAAAPRDEKPVHVAAAAPVPRPTARPTARIARLAAKTQPNSPPSAPPANAPAAAATFDLASADSQPVMLSGPAPRSENPSQSANDQVARRGLWTQVAAAPPPPTLPARPSAPVAAAAPQPSPTASDKRPGETTGAVDAPWPVRVADAADRVPAELALAYAAQTKPQAQLQAQPQAPVTRGLRVSAALPRNAATIPPARPVAAPPPAPVAALKASAPAPADPWMRALLLAPNMEEFMTSMALGPPDMRELSPMMQKPDAVVAISFGDDPAHGMATDHFSGSAVVFLNTTAFAKRTAALQR
jgi:uncharacterized protein YcbK (DUF882 family)